MRVTGSTRVAGLIGGPDQVSKSLSPAIHNAAFELMGIDWVYVVFPVESRMLETAVRGLTAAGVAGFNVTMPHKVAAARLATRLEGPAARLGAVNTMVAQGGSLVGHNTDAVGLVRFVERDVGFDVAGCRAVVIGAGGAARAAVSGLASAGAGEIAVLARNPSAAAGLEDLAEDAGFRSMSIADGASTVASANLVVNATPVGQEHDELPVVPDAIGKGTVVIDLVYRPGVTPLMSAARRRGAIAHGGLGILVNQAYLASKIWTGREPPMEAMSAAATSALAGAPPLKSGERSADYDS